MAQSNIYEPSSIPGTFRRSECTLVTLRLEGKASMIPCFPAVKQMCVVVW